MSEIVISSHVYFMSIQLVSYLSVQGNAKFDLFLITAAFCLLFLTQNLQNKSDPIIALTVFIQTVLSILLRKQPCFSYNQIYFVLHSEHSLFEMNMANPTNTTVVSNHTLRIEFCGCAKRHSSNKQVLVML